MNRLLVILKEELCEGVSVIVKETSDCRRKVIEFKSDLPISEDFFLGCLLVFLESQAPDLAVIPSDEFNCH